jgi:hypothetical protein
MDQEEKHVRDTNWELKTREATEHFKAKWPGSA